MGPCPPCYIRVLAILRLCYIRLTPLYTRAREISYLAPDRYTQVVLRFVHLFSNSAYARSVSVSLGSHTLTISCLGPDRYTQVVIRCVHLFDHSIHAHTLPLSQCIWALTHLMRPGSFLLQNWWNGFASLVSQLERIGSNRVRQWLDLAGWSIFRTV